MAKSPILRVLAYHSIKDTYNFEKQINFLSKNFDIISVYQLFDFFENKISLPKNPLLITSDDGDRSVFEKAFPIFRNYKIPAAVFVITDLIDTNRPFWWEEIENYMGRVEGNKKVWEVKTWPNKNRLEFIDTLRGEYEKKITVPQLTTEELRIMKQEGITIAGHSHTHPMFDKCTEEELQAEMQNSVEFLNKMDFDHNIFAYPNGNFSFTSERVLKLYNIKLAFLFDHQINFSLNDPLRISRLIVNDSTPLWKLKFILSGIHSKILPYIKMWARVKRKLI